ncbi:MAG: glycosyltransferase [Cellvibrionaceae bacterium]
MHWSIAAPFFNKKNTDDIRWIDDFVEGSKHNFTKVLVDEKSPEKSWHNRASRGSSIQEWLGHWQYSGKAWNQGQDGCITVFPQLATLIGLRKYYSNRNKPLVAWCFNIGKLETGARQKLAKVSLNNVDKFIVHSQRECETVSQWLNTSSERFEYMPLQRGYIEVTEEENTESPFILSMGTANRDYDTFFKAVEKLGYRTIVVAGKRSIEKLTIPKNVEIVSGISHEECRQLAQQAKINIVPLQDTPTGSGQVTIIEAMRMNKAVIATKCAGSEDYINNRETGILTSPYSVNELQDSIKELWNEDDFRQSIANAGASYSEKYFSDETAAKNLNTVLDRFL